MAASVPNISGLSISNIGSLSRAPSPSHDSLHRLGPANSSADARADLKFPASRDSAAAAALSKALKSDNQTPFFTKSPSNSITRLAQENYESRLATTAELPPPPPPLPRNHTSSPALEQLAQPLATHHFEIHPTTSHNAPPQLQTQVDAFEYKTKLRRILDLEDQIRNLESTNESLSQETSRLRARTRTLEHQTENQVVTTANLRKQNDEVICANSELQTRIAELEIENESDRGTKWKDREEMSKLSHKIEILIKENDALVEENKARMKGIEQLSTIIEHQAEEIQSLRETESSLQADLTTSLQETESLKSQNENIASQIQFLQSQLETSNDQNALLESALNDCRSAAEHERTRFEALKAALEEVTQRYHEHMEEAQESAQRERELIGALKVMEVENEEMSANVLAQTGEVESLQTQISSLHTLIQTLESRIASFQESELEVNEKIQQLMGNTEEAFLERDKALLREQQALNEVKRLNEKYAETAGKWKAKAEAEIATMRSSHLQDRKRLGDEIANLETLVSQSNAKSERALREKRAAESELEKMSKHIPEEVERLNGIIEEVAARLRSAEREKIDALEHLGSLQQKLSRDQNRHEKEKEELVYQVDDFYRRLRRAEKDLEDANETAVKNMNYISQLDHENEKLRNEKTKLQIQKESEIQAISTKHELDTTELTQKLSSLSHAHSKTCQELQHLLATQHDLAARWKSESASIVSRYENVITDLRAKISRAHETQKELESEISNAVRKTNEVMLEVEAERRNTQKAKLILRSTEEKNDLLARKVDVLLRNEHDAIAEKKQLQRQIDKMHLERERLERERSYKENRENGVTRSERRTFHETGNSIDTDSQQEVRTLQAEIARVKNKSRAAHQSANMDTYLASLDDDEISANESF